MATFPSLSEAIPPDTLSSGPGGQEEPEVRLPEDVLVARAEPSDEARRRAEERQLERLASSTTGLSDVFFGFDSWQLTDAAKQSLLRDADQLKSSPSLKLIIEGHCDERGTLAYNLVLGEKRAKSVRNYLAELGVQPERMSVVSFGKERPFCVDHSETCYQQNRRGHLLPSKD